MNIKTFITKYGKISLYNNDMYIIKSFEQNQYWDENTLLKLKKYIDPNKNILEIGGHCGTSSIVYASFLNEGKKIYVYEPQKKLYELLLKNIVDNNLSDKIIPFNKGVFCFNGYTYMNDIDIDGDKGFVEKRYNEESNLNCNFAGIGLGSSGESIEVVTIDSMDLENIGFIHCDAQGAENFIFSKSTNLVEKCKPVILFENNKKYGKLLYNNVCKNFKNFQTESNFDIVDYCINKLNYNNFIERFNRSIDTLIF